MKYIIKCFVTEKTNLLHRKLTVKEVTFLKKDSVIPLTMSKRSRERKVTVVGKMHFHPFIQRKNYDTKMYKKTYTCTGTLVELQTAVYHPLKQNVRGRN